jgi:hypothetical protein
VRSLLLAVSAIALSAGGPACAQVGDLIVDTRLRYEHVDQEGFSRAAAALTLRIRLGYETPAWNGVRLLAEGEGVTPLVERFNSSTNGKALYPLVTDPEAFELNRLQLSWSGAKGEGVIGRQRMVLGNARHIGNVGFRQNEQTFDAIKGVWKPTQPLTFTYAYLDRVHRIFGADHPQGEFQSDSHVMQVDWKTSWGSVTAYGYLLDFDNAPALSSETWGGRLAGQRPLADGMALVYAAEFARQTDYAAAPLDFDLTYIELTAGLKKNAHTATVSVERLDGDGRRGFQTPLATLHAFQGFADVFLNTPVQGVRDINLRASTAVNGPHGKPVRLAAALHDFDAADGDIDFGRELDLVASTPISEHLTAELKAAFFKGEVPGFADRTKIWTTLEWRF